MALKLYPHVRRLIPLYLLPQSECRRLCAELVVEEARKGETLFSRGDVPTHWIYVLEGTVVLESQGVVMEEVKGGSDAARFPLAHQVPFKVQARALTPLRYIRIDYNRLQCMNNSQEHTATNPSQTSAVDTRDWLTRLLKSPVFQQLPPSNLQKILQNLEEVELSADTPVITQSEPADCVYILRRGSCRVSRQPRPNAREIKLGELHPGDMFGEDALLSGRPRAVNVVMLTDGVVLRLRRDAFMKWLVEPVLTWISFESAFGEIERDAAWLDVRDPAEFGQLHIEGSLNVPFFSLRMQLGTLQRQRRYVTVCQDGKLAAAAAFVLLRHGFEAVVLEGGLGSVPCKCLTGEAASLESVGDEPDPETGEAPVSASREEHDPESLQAQEPSLREQLVSLQAQNRSLMERLQALERDEQAFSQLQQEKRSLEEEVMGLRNRLQELETVVQRYHEEIAELSNDEIIQALQTELQMVRQQADEDVAVLRRRLEKLGRQLRQEKTEAEPEADGSSLLDDLAAVDPEQLPLQPPPSAANAGGGRPAGALTAAVWFSIGLLVSFTLLGIAVQTGVIERWLTTWSQEVTVNSDGSGSPARGAEGRTEAETGAPDIFVETDQEDLFAQ